MLKEIREKVLSLLGFSTVDRQLPKDEKKALIEVMALATSVLKKTPRIHELFASLCSVTELLLN